MSTQGDLKSKTNRDPDRKYFSVDEANSALPYVSRVLSDIREAYATATELQQRMDHPSPLDDAQSLRGEYDQAINKLTQYTDELQEVGVELKDYDQGLVDFPCWHDGREVCLCWKAGEDQIKAWHEADAGFMGRQDIETLG
ncbi:MAG: DUF2203 family protein [Planctomycetota bacterium]|jgi:hypothetical protein